MIINDCKHFPEKIATQRTDHCEGGDVAVSLRVCLTCGHVGCCDSSPGKHARAHAKETGHQVMASYPVEVLVDGSIGSGSMVWCYIENDGDGDYLQYE